jgi:hypothetical protein
MMVARDKHSKGKAEFECSGKTLPSQKYHTNTFVCFNIMTKSLDKGQHDYLQKKLGINS